MRHFNDKDEYEGFVQEVAQAERDLTEGVPEEDIPEHADGYEGYEDEYTIAKRVIGVPIKVGDEVTMKFNGEPWVDTRACPVSVFLRTDQEDVVTDEIINDKDIWRGAVEVFARDLRDELT